MVRRAFPLSLSFKPKLGLGLYPSDHSYHWNSLLFLGKIAISLAKIHLGKKVYYADS